MSTNRRMTFLTIEALRSGIPRKRIGGQSFGRDVGETVESNSQVNRYDVDSGGSNKYLGWT